MKENSARGLEKHWKKIRTESLEHPFLLEKSHSIYPTPRSKEQTQGKLHTQSNFSNLEVSVITPISLASWPKLSTSYMQRGRVLFPRPSHSPPRHPHMLRPTSCFCRGVWCCVNSGNTLIFGSGTTLTVKPREYKTRTLIPTCVS